VDALTTLSRCDTIRRRLTDFTVDRRLSTVAWNQKEPKVIAIVDYGMGNLRSVEKALQKLGHHAAITASPADIHAADRVILPGVGAFGAAMANLSESRNGDGRLLDAVVEAARSGRPFLGICLGMQLLLSESEELGCFFGLDLVPGQVVRFSANGSGPIKIPHMGWNALHLERDSPLLRGVPDGAMVYFVHSYLCRPDDPEVVVATADHGDPFCAVLQRRSIFATQFHPEKSGDLGLRMLDNFARLPVDGV
jgi:glutamine amidotransferase